MKSLYETIEISESWTSDAARLTEYLDDFSVAMDDDRAIASAAGACNAPKSASIGQIRQALDLLYSFLEERIGEARGIRNSQEFWDNIKAEEVESALIKGDIRKDLASYLASTYEKWLEELAGRPRP